MISTAFAQAAGAAAPQAAPFYTDPTFWVAVSFVVFFAAAIKWVWPLVAAALDQKIDAIRDRLDEATRLREEAQELLSNYKRKLAEAESEAEGIINEARNDAQLLREKLTADLEHSLQRREQLALERIAQAESEATAEVRAMTVDVAINATRDVLRDAAAGDKAVQLIDDSISELPTKLN
jgi:F-type H+-transporting ATPase subunit b